MGLLRTEGIVIGTLKLGEADKIITLFTLERGKVEGAAKGARRFKNRFGSALEPLTHGTFHLFEKEGRSLHRLDRVDPIRSFQTLREDFAALTCTAFMLDLLRHFTPQEESHPEVFRLLLGTLGFLAEKKETRLPGEERGPADELTKGQRKLMDWFHLRFLVLAGYRPRLDQCVRCGRSLPPGRLTFAPGQGGILCAVCPGGAPAASGIPLSGAALAFLRQAMKIPLPLMDRHLPTEGVLREVRTFLDGYTRFLTGKEIPARRFMNALSGGAPAGPS